MKVLGVYNPIDALSGMTLSSSVPRGLATLMPTMATTGRCIHGRYENHGLRSRRQNQRAGFVGDQMQPTELNAVRSESIHRSRTLNFRADAENSTSVSELSR